MIRMLITSCTGQQGYLSQLRILLNIESQSNIQFIVIMAAEICTKKNQELSRLNIKKNEMKNLFKEIIEFCKNENSSVLTYMTGIIYAKREVLNMFGQAQQQGLRTTASGQKNQYTPIKQEDRHSSKVQKDIKFMILQNILPEQTLQLINQIDSRTFAEIEKLKAQNNNQMRRNSQLQGELSYYRNSQLAPGSGYQSKLTSKMAYLEGLLQKDQHGHGNLGVGHGIDLTALYAQGEAIKQEILRLLRIKEASMNRGSYDWEERQLRISKKPRNALLQKDIIFSQNIAGKDCLPILLCHNLSAVHYFVQRIQ